MGYKEREVSTGISFRSTCSVWLIGPYDSADPKLLEVSMTGSLASPSRSFTAWTPGAKPMPSAADKYSLFEMQFLACSTASCRTFSNYVLELLVMSWILSDLLSSEVRRTQQQSIVWWKLYAQNWACACPKYTAEWTGGPNSHIIYPCCIAVSSLAHAYGFRGFTVINWWREKVFRPGSQMSCFIWDVAAL